MYLEETHMNMFSQSACFSYGKMLQFPPTVHSTKLTTSVFNINTCADEIPKKQTNTSHLVVKLRTLWLKGDSATRLVQGATL